MASVEVMGLSFAHSDAAPVFEDVSSSFFEGWTGLTGENGAGKTTLLELIPRLSDPTAGTVRIDGVDVRDRDPEALWAELQDGYEDYLEDWDAGEVVPVAAVSAASAPDHEFAWLFLDWRDDEPRVVVTTTDRWSTGTGVASLADLGLVAT